MEDKQLWEEKILFQVFDVEDYTILRNGFLKTEHIPAKAIYFDTDCNLDAVTVSVYGKKPQVGFTHPHMVGRNQPTRLYVPETFLLHDSENDVEYFQIIVPEHGNFHGAIRGLASLMQFPHPARIKRTAGWNEFSEIDFPAEFKPDFEIQYLDDRVRKIIERI
jgi:hypothetical protein